MQKITSLLIAFVIAFSALSQTENILTGTEANNYFSGAEIVRIKGQNLTPDFIQLKKDHAVPLSNKDIWLKKILKIDERSALTEMNVLRDKLGMTHYKYQQYVNAIPVEGGVYILHTKDNYILSANGNYYSSINIGTSPSITAETAIQKAKEAVPSEQYMWEVEGADKALQALLKDENAHYYPQPTLCIIAEKSSTANPTYHLVWKMDIYSSKPVARYWVYIDAQTGSVLQKEKRIHTTDVPGTATTAFSGVRPIVCDQNGSTYRLREAGRGNGIETFNMNNGTNYNSVTDFTSTSTNFNSSVPAGDKYGRDAHWGAEMTYDYYNNVHSRNSIDGAGFNLWSYVHYDVGYENAFWDGQRMTYGDGDTYFTSPLTALEITGHEISHGLTSYTANLDYQDESGALNESFSDIFGVTIDNWARGTTGANLWLIGEDTHAGGIRSMSNPNAFGDPDTYHGTNYYTGTNDNGGVHTNSNVQNFWYYLLSTGGSGTNDIGNSYSVTGIGMSSAADIAFRNLTVYLTNTSDYSDSRFYSILSAIDFFGGCSQEVASTTNAWYAVGVGAIYSPVTVASFSTPITDFCQAPSTVNFTNNSQNGISYLWNFGDGSTSTQQSPSHTYTNYGQYTVKLVVYGGVCGNDSITQTDYINLDQNIPCNVSLTGSGSNPTQTSCTGTLSDDGGLSANYTDNVTSVITIAPTGATGVTLNFSSFNFENNYDYLYIYDGPSTGSPLIGAYTGSTLPNGGTISSTGGSITIEQSSDPYVNESGFVLTWQCAISSLAPQAEFSASTVTSCDGNVYFTDESLNGVSSWLWDFGDGGTSTLQNPSHNYANDGTYTVKLVVNNIVGSDSITKVSYIQVNHIIAPVINDTSICAPDSLILNASASGTINWYADSTLSTLLNTGSNYTTGVISNSTTYYLQNESSNALGNVGPINHNYGSGGYHNNTAIQYLEFTVYAPITIKSVWVDAASAGNRTINLWDAGGQLIDTRLVNIPAGTGTIILNLDVQPGMYRLGGASMNLYRNDNSTSFPYSLSGVVDITGSSAGSAYYYYFYNWQIEQVCKSAITEVNVDLWSNSTPFTSIETTPLTVSFTSGVTGSSSYSWDFGDGGISALQNPTHTYATSGNYTVTEIVSSFPCSDTIINQIFVKGYTDIKSEQQENFEVNVFPNPANDFATIVFNTPLLGIIDISVYDLTGRLVENIYNGNLLGKKQTVMWNTKNVRAGIYVIQFKSGSKVVPLKIVVD